MAEQSGPVVQPPPRTAAVTSRIETRFARLFAGNGKLSGEADGLRGRARGGVFSMRSARDLSHRGGGGRIPIGICWNRGWWVDEARGCVVIVAVGKQYREVDLETGRITHADEAVVLGSLRSESTNVRRVARELSRDAPQLTENYVEASIVSGWVGLAFLIGVLATLTGLLLALRNLRRRRRHGSA